MNEILKNMLSQTFGTNLFSDVVDILKMNPITKFPQAWSLVENIHTSIIMPIALAFVVVHVLIAIMEKATSDHCTPQQFLNIGLKFLAAKYFIENGMELFTGIINGGTSMLSGLSTSGNVTSGFDQILWQTITGKGWTEEVGFMESIGYMLYILLPWVFTFVIIIVLKAQAYTRTITILLRIAFAPLAVSDFFTEGIHGAGWRYIKNTIAIAIQGVVMFAVVSISSYILQGIIDSMGAGGWSYLQFNCAYFAVACCCIAMLGKSQQMAKEVMGTG